MKKKDNLLDYLIRLGLIGRGRIDYVGKSMKRFIWCERTILVFWQWIQVLDMFTESYNLEHEKSWKVNYFFILFISFCFFFSSWPNWKLGSYKNALIRKVCLDVSDWLDISDDSLCSYWTWKVLACICVVWAGKNLVCSVQMMGLCGGFGQFCASGGTLVFQTKSKCEVVSCQLLCR